MSNDTMLKETGEPTGTHHRGSPEERRALALYVKLARASLVTETRINRHLAEAGLTASQFGVLEALYHLGPLYQRQLADKILKSSGNLTVVVDNLAKRGLAWRERSAEDRRRVLIRLTDEGRALVREIFPRHVRGVVRAFDALDPTEQDELARLLRKLGKSRGKERP